MKRQSGVLLPVFSLPGKYGCGTFGEGARRWIETLKKGGFSCWQVLPFGITDDHNSPYMPFSSFGGNPLFIDPEALFRQGLVTRTELAAQIVEDPYLCQYETLKKIRLPFLRAAAARVKDRAPVEAFIKANPHIGGTCRYLAKKEANGERPWPEWTSDEPDAAVLFAWQFIQYEFHRQWQEVHTCAAKNGISIIGDLPFYVSHDSYDVWSRPDQFLLDQRNHPAFVAGVPPDYFSADGQLWGNPIYDWARMGKDGFSFWKERFGYMLTLFDGIRIDHFRAISAFWRVPADAKSAKEGRWIKGPGKKLIDALSPLAAGKAVWAEDLGIIDDDTRRLLAESGYPGMAVFQFGFDGNPLSPHLPHNYGENLIAYTGSHDNNTLLGFWWGLDEATRRAASDYLGNPQDLCAATIRALFMSRAGTVIFPVQDLLGFGADTRINTPGRADGNWRYRITAEQMAAIDVTRFAHLNRIYAR